MPGVDKTGNYVPDKYPMMLYKRDDEGKVGHVHVNDEDEEAKARKDGWSSDYDAVRKGTADAKPAGKAK